jgi:hypothetical protein
MGRPSRRVLFGGFEDRLHRVLVLRGELLHAIRIACGLSAMMESQIRPMFEAARVTSEPKPIFWRELETEDKFGWDA